ncbi:SHOCT domain-containing protein [Natronobiforma cellulositropha]|uniref:SHOCT domain-containing protein n=1 Tax=Natronobiforma cellulositropha TaxID=1679076 RepID=UPI0021D5DED0|nr:SHOCT domain-containing protein [Natronobiforma cellulositropha]
MDERTRRFIASELWLLIGLVTFALAGLVTELGLVFLSGPIAIVGWFLLTPIFLFWGDEIAAWLAENDGTAEREDDPLEELKRRYADGEIDDAEFEHRLERLLGVDDALEGVFDNGRGDARADGPHASAEAGTPDEGDRDERVDDEREPDLER